jgi:calcineurin-like phosphoesterase family protein
MLRRHQVIEGRIDNSVAAVPRLLGTEQVRVFVIADTHFFHDNIIKYCGRPFRGGEEMNEFLLDEWNRVVSPEDLVIHCGDVALGQTELIIELCNKLNGTKILVEGNHDRRKSVTVWKQAGFELVKTKPWIVGQFVFSHEPVVVPDWGFNYHGHSHGMWAVPGANHMCVSVECLQYTPKEINFGGNVK